MSPQLEHVQGREDRIPERLVDEKSLLTAAPPQGLRTFLAKIARVGAVNHLLGLLWT